MKIFEKPVIDFIIRNVLWIALGLAALWLLEPTLPEIRTLLLIIVIETLAISLSGIAMYCYTKIPFTKYLLEGDDKAMNGVERHAAVGTLGYIFIGVHILVGLVVLGTYIAQFA